MAEEADSLGEAIEEARRAFIESYIDNQERPDLDLRNTLFFRILDELTREVANRAIQRGSADLAELEDCYTAAGFPITLGCDAAGEANHDTRWNLWRHHPGNARELSRHAAEPPDADALAWVLEEYSKQAARSGLLDRTLIDMLMAREVLLLADALYVDPHNRTGGTRHTLARLSSVAARIVWRTCFTGLVLVAVASMIHADAVAVPAGVTIILLGVVNSMRVIANRIARWFIERQRCAQLCDAMTNAYDLLRDERGPVSVAALEAALDRTTAFGANWAGLPPILNDLRRRGETYLPAIGGPSF